jgi:hypothetical protein
MKKIKLLAWFFCFLFFTLIFFLLPENALAESYGLSIGRVQANPSNPSGTEWHYEWFEILNNSSIDINLTGWKIADNVAEDVLDGAIVKANGRLTIGADSIAFLEIFPGFSEDFFNLESQIGNGLANSSDRLKLIDNLGMTIDEVIWSKDFGNGNCLKKDEISLETVKIFPCSPGAPKSYSEFLGVLKINEILPSPESGSEEFIELYNNSDQEIDLLNWQIDDLDGGSTPYTFLNNSIIGAGGFLSILQSESGIYLNNDGDQVRLIAPSGEIIDLLEYDESETGKSYSSFSNGFLWTSQITQNMINIADSSSVELPPPEEIKPIKSAKTQETGEIVTISGKVSVPPGIFSNQYFYLEDGSAGIQIYKYDKEFPDLAEGNQVTITGELSSRSGEQRIKVASSQEITVTDSTEKGLEPLSDPPIESQMVGRLIKITGTVEDASGQYIYLNYQGKTLPVYIIRNTDIKKPHIKSGDQLEIWGILSYYKDDFRLLPRYQSDIRIISSSENLPNSGSDLLLPIIFAGLTELIICQYLIQSKKAAIWLKKLQKS